MKLRKGDKVLVIAGKDRHKTGVIEKVLPKANRAVIAGVNMVKKHLKRSAKNPQGGILEVPASIHLSNLMLLDSSTNKPTRVGYRQSGKTIQRISKTSGDIVKTAEKK